MNKKLNILKEKLGNSICIDDYEKIQPYLTEERGKLKGSSDLLLKPRNTKEVSKILRLCDQNKISVVPQGGRTGLSGGTIPDASKNEVIISMERMNKILSIDKNNMRISVQSGCTLQNIKDFSIKRDLYFHLKLPSMATCTIGGNISTNAGGSSVLKYGMTRDMVLGLEIVLPNGKVLNCLREIKKDNRSYDLKHIFIGSEGTLGIITSAVLKLYPAPQKKGLAIVALKSINRTIEFLSFINSFYIDNLTSYELNSSLGLKFIKNNFSEIPIPFENKYNWYVIFELSFNKKIDINHEIEDLLEKALKKNLILDAIKPQNIKQLNNIWKTRELLSYAQKKDGPSIKHDISLPISKIPIFLKKAENKIYSILKDANILVFGHLADGNIHYNISSKTLLDKTKLDFFSKKINNIVFDLVYKYGGSFSAEHGIGKMKIKELEKYSSCQELSLKKQIKNLFDPHGIMNPGKVFNL